MASLASMEGCLLHGGKRFNAHVLHELSDVHSEFVCQCGKQLIKHKSRHPDFKDGCVWSPVSDFGSYAVGLEEKLYLFGFSKHHGGAGGQIEFQPLFLFLFI